MKAALQQTRKSNFVVDLVRRFGLYVHGVDIPLAGSYDSAKMTAALEKVARQIDIPAASAGLTVVDGEVKIARGTEGQCRRP